MRPGTDSALFGAMLHVLIRARLARPRVHRRPHHGFDEAAAAVAEITPAWAAGITGVPAARIEQAAEWWGTSETGMLLHARGIEHHTKGVENVLAAINLGLATGKYGKPGCGVTTITGQGNGQGGREHGHKCDQLPGNRDITNPEHRAYIASVWGCDESEIPGKGITAQEIIEAIHAGEIKGLLSICFNPVVSAPDTTFTAEALDRLEFYAVIDFFLSEPAHHADVVLPVAARGGRGHVDQRRGTDHQDQRGRRPARRGPRSTGRSSSTSPAGSARASTSRTRTPSRSSRSSALASEGGTADYPGITWQRIEDEMGLFWPIPEVGHPGTPRLFEGGRFYHPDGKARFHAVPFRARPRWSTTSTRSG